MGAASRSTLRLVCGLGAAMACIGVTAVARGAQGDADKETQAPSEAAYQDLVKEGVAEFRRGNYPEAYSLFERAHAVQPNARTLRGMGLAAFEERRYVACIQHLKASLADTRKPLTDALREHAEEVLHRSEAFVAQYKLEVTPAGAEVLVDARPATIVEGTLLLDPGEHEIVVSVEGHQETRHVEAQPNESLVLRIKLTPTGKTAEAEAKDSAPASWFTRTRTAGVVVGGAGVASLATSLALTLKARSERDAAGCTPDECPSESAKTQLEDAETLGTAATVTMVVGAAVTATGLALALWPLQKDESDSGASAQVGLSLAPGFAGVQVGGQW